VTARVENDRDPVEAAHVLLTHASGAISHVAGLWGPQHLPFTTEYSVTGTGGTLAHSSAAEQNYRSELAAAGSADGFLPVIDPAEDPYYAELREFVDAIQGGPMPRVSAADGVAAVALANAARRSLETGQPVELPSFSRVGA
jgi:myo-inositol 2-dehydrogenase/D-chiro-inositol 1-dehydrogenase